MENLQNLIAAEVNLFKGEIHVGDVLIHSGDPGLGKAGPVSNGVPVVLSVVPLITDSRQPLLVPLVYPGLGGVALRALA